MIYIGIQNDPGMEHHGIKGQKWGVRRFQNEDGTLTEAGRKRYNRYSKDLYKRLKKDRTLEFDARQRKYEGNKLIKSITNDKDRLKALENLKNTKYDGPNPEEEYDPFLDEKIINQAKKEFERVEHRKFDPENYQDEKVLGYIMDDIADRTGAYAKAEKLNKAPNWDKAYDQYVKANEKAIKKVLGSMASLKLETFRGSQDYESVVNELISEIDHRR